MKNKVDTKRKWKISSKFSLIWFLNISPEVIKKSKSFVLRLHSNPLERPSRLHLVQPAQPTHNVLTGWFNLHLNKNFSNPNTVLMHPVKIELEEKILQKSGLLNGVKWALCLKLEKDEIRYFLVSNLQ